VQESREKKSGLFETETKMTPTIKAILARFGGNRGAAMDYAIAVARAYPHLATEYWTILDTLKGARNAGE